MGTLPFVQLFAPLLISRARSLRLQSTYRSLARLHVAPSLTFSSPPLAERIKTSFLGFNWKTGDQTRTEMNRALAIQKLTQLSICDICYLNEYSCEFATYYYQCGMTQYVDLKLPEPFGALWYREFRESFPDNGPRIEFAKHKMNQECTQARLYIFKPRKPLRKSKPSRTMGMLNQIL